MLSYIFKNATGFFLLTLVIVVTGVVLASGLPVMMYPQTRRPQVQINIRHPGISAVDFQDQYAGKVEPKLLSLEDLDSIETTYSTDSSSFVLTFAWEIKSDLARSAVENIMISVNNSLPEEIKDSYSVRAREGENAGYMVMGITSPSTPPETLYQILTDTLQPALGKVSDVEEIGFYNTQQLVVDLILNQRKMLAYGITILDVNAALQSGFIAVPLGSLNTEEGRLSLRLEKQGRTLESLPRLEVKKVGDTSVSLDDIAQIDIKYTLPNRVFLVKDKAAVQLTATPVEGGNVNAMTSNIKLIMDNAIRQGVLPKDTQYFLYLDPAKYIQRSIDNVVQSALLGGALAVLIVFLILGEVRNTLIIAASLPLSIVISFIMMSLFGVSLNLISLGGLALAVGMIVDSTIVVMENIHRLRKEAPGHLQILQWKKLVLTAVAQVRAPVIASTLTSVLVFLPISFTAPLTNAILGDQAKTVVYALMSSLVVSLTLVPLVAFYLYRGQPRLPKKGFSLIRLSESSVQGVIAVYRKSLRWLMARKRRSAALLFGSFVLLGLALIFILPLIPKGIIATPTSDRIVLFFRNNTITEPEDLMRDVIPGMTTKIEETLGPLMIQKFTNLSGRFNQTFIDLRSSADTTEAKSRLEKAFVSEGDWYYNVLAWDPAALPLPMTFDFQLSIFGPDVSKKVEILTSVQALLTEADLYQRIFTRPSSSITSELNLTPRQETINRLSPWSESTLTNLIRRILSGTTAITMTDGTQDVAVTAAYPKEEMNSQNNLEDFLIPWKQSFIPLKHFFDFTRSQGVSQIYSENGEPVYRVYASAGMQVSEGERIEIQKKAKAFLEENLTLPAGYSFSFDNPQVEMDKSIQSLFLALGISILLIYLLLAFQFNSLWIPLVILVTIPLGFIGVIFSLWIFRSTLNLNALLGTILLAGVVVNNAIILIDFYLIARHEYPNKRVALEVTAGLRFQPILITTMTTIIGMLPLALGMGEGSNILQPLGIAVSGGLMISTLFTLYAVPAILSLTMKEHQEALPAAKVV